MLLLEGVHKSYLQGPRRVDALRGLDLELTEPGLYAVMGPSGSGKSTLLHLLAGLDKPDRGVVRVNGTDVTQLGDAALTRLRRKTVGIVFQQYNLIPTLTGRQNVALPAVFDRRPRRWIDGRVDALLEQMGLTDRAGHRPEALSGGEQQRFAIARALMLQPPLLLADEPTGALDSASSRRLWELLEQLATESSMTVLMVTHETAAAAHCRDAFFLEDGRITRSFRPDSNDALELATGP
jgi:putative ABC transport system ATP-binding protein